MKIKSLRETGSLLFWKSRNFKNGKTRFYFPLSIVKFSYDMPVNKISYTILTIEIIVNRMASIPIKLIKK